MAETLSEQLIRHEGLRLKPYRCPAGKLSIGVGRNLDDVGITKEEAMNLLLNDISRCLINLRAALPWFGGLNAARQDVLINMAFNLGVKGLLGFKKTLSLIEQGKYTEASEEMLRSAWAQQVGKRAVELAEIMRTGVRG